MLNVITGGKFGMPFYLGTVGALTKILPLASGNLQMLMGYALTATDLYVQVRNWGVV
jgi:hypothetical protein